MTKFSESYLGQLRELVGSRLLRVPGTRIVIEKENGEILLQKRSDFAVWGLPGGSGEPGESVEETIRREVIEETGLTLGTITPIGYASDPSYEVITFPNGHVCHFHSLIFWSRDFSGSLDERDSETLELAWFAPETLPQLLTNMMRSITAFQQYQKTGLFQLI